MSTIEGEPPDPRSPRSGPTATAANDDEAAANPTGAAAAAAPTAAPSFAARTPFLDDGAGTGAGGPGLPHQRPNLGSMLFLTAFFFFMSSNNTPPPIIVVGPDGQIQPRVTTLDRAREQVNEYRAFLNGTAGPGNGTATWVEGPRPQVLPSAIMPSRYTHPSGPEHHFYTNITGFHREATAHSISLVDSPLPSQEGFFHHVRLPSLNSSAHPQWNETRAKELRGGFDWAGVDKWEMNVKEKAILPRITTDAKATNNASVPFEDDEWAWVRGTITLHAATSPRDDTITDNASVFTSTSIDYDFRGLHHLPNGTFELFGMPDGAYIDLRNIPRLYDLPEHRNVTRAIIMRELEKELDVQEKSLLLTDVRPDDYSLRTHCPLLLHLALPPIPTGTDLDSMRLYDQELRHPTGLLSSLSRPPLYWQHGGLGGVIVADQCGIAIGLDGGKGIKLDDFWRKSIDYAAFATLAQLLVLFLLVRQMERTRTPSTLAKVSLWSIVMMGAADSWIFSAHVAVGTMSDNKTSLPLLVPGFLALCTAIVFGPRYAVMLYRVQAPERVSIPASTASAVVPSPADALEAGNPAPTTPALGPIERVQAYFNDHPRLRWMAIALAAFTAFQLVLIPSILPLFLFSLYSFWLPQIWRNATRGSLGVDKVFILGTSLGRLALPLYALGCPDNVFFFETTRWIFGLAAWQAAQVAILFAQERFGASFFLPKSLAPAEGYNYHPLLPFSPADQTPAGDASPKSPSSASALALEAGLDTQDRTCSICMEHVDTRPTPHASAPTGPGAEALTLLSAATGRWHRNYALAPCGHLFHTNCLAQWLAIKTICPLCKRSLPPL